MSPQAEVADIVKSILIQHFDVRIDHYDPDQSLEALHEDFKLLGNLVILENLIRKKFKKDIPLLEHINTAFHRPKNIVNLILNML